MQYMVRIAEQYFSKYCLHTSDKHAVAGKTFTFTNSVSKLLKMLLIVSGDVELNPGTTGASSPSTDMSKKSRNTSAQGTDHHLLICDGQLFTACTSCKVKVDVKQKQYTHCGLTFEASQRKTSRDNCSCWV